MNFVREILPNPFDKNSTLVGLKQKAIMLSQVFTYPHFIRNVVLLLIAGVILIEFYLLPQRLIIIVVGYGIVMQLIYMAVSTFAIRNIRQFPNPVHNSGTYSWQLTLKAAYFDVIRGLIGLLGACCLYLLVLLLFKDLAGFYLNLPKFTIPTHMFFGTTLSVKTLLLFWVAIKVFSFAFIYFKYLMSKRIRMTDSFAENERVYSIWKSKWNYLTSTLPFLIICLFLIIIGVPVAILAPFILFFLFLGFVTKKYILSMQDLSYNQNSVPTSTPKIQGVLKSILNRNKNDRNSSQDITPFPDEKIKTVVFGVMRVAPDLKGVFSIRGGGNFFSGVGTYIDRENSLIITNHRLLLIEIPVTGGDTVMGELNYVQENILYNRKEIREKGEEYITSTQLDQIIKGAVHNYLFTNIKKVLSEKWNITIEFYNGDKYKAHIFDKEYGKTIHEVLSSLLLDKLVIK